MKLVIRKILNALLLAACFIAPRKKADKIFEPKKVLIIQTAKLGDMVCTTPMFRAIKEKYPNNFLIVSGNKINRQLLENNHDVDEYLVFEGSWKFFLRIRKMKIDFACLCSPSFEILAALYLAGIKCISATRVEGDCYFETRPYRILSNLIIAKKHDVRGYAPAQYLKLLEPIEIYSQDTTKHLGFLNDSIKIKKTVIIAPSAGNKLKLWGGKRFAQLADLIYRDGYNILIIGNGNDKPQIDEMISSLSPETKYINAYNKYTLDEVKSLISKADFFISADTGLIFIAEAFNIPTIDITGPVDENVQPPNGGNHKVIFNDVACRPCAFIMNPKTKCHNKENHLGCFDVRPIEVYNLFKETLLNKI